jgi:beta-phosphoglucomutase
VIRAVVFDFDGVIANSEPLHLLAFQDVLVGEGVTLHEDEYYESYLGFDDVGVFRTVGRHRGRTWDRAAIAALVDRKATRMEELERARSVLFPGAAAAIERLSGRYSLAIASGALKPEILRVLEHAALTRHFQTIVSAEDTPASKPAPDPYALAVTRLAGAIGASLDARDCVAIEDSRWGLESARAAGLHTIGITHTYPASELRPADLVIDSLDALTRETIANLSPPSDPRN